MLSSLKKEHGALGILWIAVSAMLLCSATFYFYTEDYESVLAAQALLRGETTMDQIEWPFSPFVPYLHLWTAKLFGNTVLIHRSVVAVLMGLMVFPLFAIFRKFLSAPLAFVCTLFCFALCTFPIPRPLYYFEGFFGIMALFFCFHYLDTKKTSVLIFMAFSLTLAFLAHGYPNIVLLIGLIAVLFFIEPFIPESLETRLSSAKRFYAGLFVILLVSALGLFHLRVLQYAFLPSWLMSTYLNPLTSLLTSNLIFFYALFAVLAIVHGGVIQSFLTQVRWITFVSALKTPILYGLILITFFALSILLMLMRGYDIRDVFFYFYPLDSIQIHSSHGGDRNIVGKLSLLLWSLSVFGATLVVYREGRISKRVFLVGLASALFVLSAIPRYFPDYHLYILAVLPTAFTLFVLIPSFVAMILGKSFKGVSCVYRIVLGVFLFGLGSWGFYRSSVGPGLSDLRNQKLVLMDQWPLQGIHIPLNQHAFLNRVEEHVKTRYDSHDRILFLSDQNLQFVPLLASMNSPYGGINLTRGLGLIRSVDEILKQSLQTESPETPRDRVIQKWRGKMLTRFEEFKPTLLILPALSENSPREFPLDSHDPFVRYLAQNYRFDSTLAFPEVPEWRTPFVSFFVRRD